MSRCFCCCTCCAWTSEIGTRSATATRRGNILRIRVSIYSGGLKAADAPKRSGDGAWSPHPVRAYDGGYKNIFAEECPEALVVTQFPGRLNAALPHFTLPQRLIRCLAYA